MLKKIFSPFKKSTSLTTPSYDQLDRKLQPITPESLLSQHQTDIDRLCVAWSDEASWNAHILPSILNLAAFCQHLPYAPKGLFADRDGLFQGALACGRYSLEIMEGFVRLDRNIRVQDEIQTRFKAAALFAGLFALIGVVHQKMTIKVDAPRNDFFHLKTAGLTPTFSALATPYYTWITSILKDAPNANVTLQWKETIQRRHHGADMTNVFLVRHLLAPETLQWLAAVNDLALWGLLESITNVSSSNTVSTIIRAKELGVYRACLLERERLGAQLGENLRVQGWETTLIRILRERVRNDWTINSKDSPLRMGAEGLFLFWPDVCPFLLNDLKNFGLTELPTDPSLWAGMLLSSGITLASKNRTATCMIAVTSNAKPREALKLNYHYLLEKEQIASLKTIKRPFEVTIKTGIETGLSQLTRDVLTGLVGDLTIETDVKQKKPQVIWNVIESTLHPDIAPSIEALMERLTIEPAFAKASIVDEGVLLFESSIPELPVAFDMLVMQLLLAKMIYENDRHEPLWVEHIMADGQTVRAVIVKPTVFSIDYVEDDTAAELAFETVFEVIHGRAPTNRWADDAAFQLNLVENDHE